MAAPTGSAPTSPGARTAPPVDIEAVVDVVAEGAAGWAAVGPSERAAMLERLAARTDAVAEAWVEAGTAAKKVDPDSPVVGEEWMGGPWALIAGALALAATLRAVESGGLPFPEKAVSEREGGQLVVQVYPTTLTESLLLSGYTAEVWQDPELTRPELQGAVAELYRGAREDRGVCAVMGAGNIASITPLDVLYALMAEGFTVVAKLSPINGYLQPQLEHIFEEFIARDWVRLVQGDAQVGERLVTHPKVRAVHVTGSSATHDAIVFGTGEAGAAQRATGASRLDKPVTAELGGVTPVIVVPGKWTTRDLKFQAEHLATQKLHNAGHNCVASQVVILPADWDQADAFTHHLEHALRTVAPRDQYYPGSDGRYQQMRAVAPSSKELGGGSPPRLLAELDATQDEAAFRTEAFGTFLGITRLPGGTEEYLRAATDFANDTLIGTLGINLLVDPKTAKQHEAALDQAIGALRYGSVCVNAWAGVGFLLARATWGAFPGASVADIQSGTGIVHNAYLFGRPQKTVIRAPFRAFPFSIARGELSMAPKPPWFVTNKTGATTGRRLTRHAAKPGLGKLAGIFSSALRG